MLTLQDKIKIVDELLKENINATAADIIKEINDIEQELQQIN